MLVYKIVDYQVVDDGEGVTQQGSSLTNPARLRSGGAYFFI